MAGTSTPIRTRAAALMAEGYDPAAAFMIAQRQDYLRHFPAPVRQAPAPAGSYAELREQTLRASEDIGPGPGMVRTSGLQASPTVGGPAKRQGPAQPPEADPGGFDWRDGQWQRRPSSYELARQQALGIPLKASEVRDQRLTASEREATYQLLKAEALRNPMGSAPLKASEYTGPTDGLAEAALAYQAMRRDEGVKITLAEATIAVAPRRTR
jgi:hypothetical protein